MRCHNLSTLLEETLIYPMQGVLKRVPGTAYVTVDVAVDFAVDFKVYMSLWNLSGLLG